MQFTDVRRVPAASGHVWDALHDHEVLLMTIPGCEALRPTGPGEYAATLAARVGRLADTYRGTFTIDDIDPGAELVVSVNGRGRCGHLELDLRVRLEAVSAASTLLAYDARAHVGGLVARLGRAPLTVAAGHVTGCFFHGLERAVTRPVHARSASGLLSAGGPRR